jgi:hypothetical protein
MPSVRPTARVVAMLVVLGALVAPSFAQANDQQISIMQDDDLLI